MSGFEGAKKSFKEALVELVSEAESEMKKLMEVLDDRVRQLENRMTALEREHAKE